MSQNSDGLKKIVKEHSEKLAKLGIELAKNQFSYKVENKPSKEYWQKRIDDFKKYNEKGMEYYNEIHSLMNIINREESQMFLLRIGKFRQIGLVFIVNGVKKLKIKLQNKAILVLILKWI
jgi:adenylate kinase family enzyme